MSPHAGKRVLKPGAPSVFVGGEARRSYFSLRLDVRDEARGKRRFFARPRRSGAERARPKLFHYISAGGMRQLRRTSGDDLADERRRSFLGFLFCVALVWLVFYFAPCV